MEIFNLVVFSLICALIAGIFGFTGISVAFSNIAQILFLLFIISFFVSLIIYIVKGRRPQP